MRSGSKDTDEDDDGEADAATDTCDHSEEEVEPFFGRTNVHREEGEESELNVLTE